jgi:hypothetical protein
MCNLIDHLNYTSLATKKIYSKMKTNYLSVWILLLSSLSLHLRAQDTAFWFAAPHTSEDQGHAAYPAFLAISNGTQEEAHIEITLYNGGGNNVLTIRDTIAPGDLYKHTFSNTAEVRQIENPRSLAGSVTQYGAHINSDVQVTAYYMINHVGTRDIFTLKGHQALGTRFYVPMQHDNAAQTGNFAGAFDQIDMVATKDGTTVTVIPTVPVVNTSGTGPNPSPAGTPIVRTLHKGQTLKIMEQTINTGSLAGTEIIASEPIAVTVTEDMVGGGDTSGDQIVPVNSLGTRYVVPRGYMLNPAMERFYLVASEAGTTVKIYDDPNNASTYTPISLNAAGAAARYTFPVPTLTDTVYVVYVEANKPVYIYHRTGYGEEGAALLPSLYAIGQKQLAFYQVSTAFTGSTEAQKGFLVFHTGAEGSFTVSYGSGSPSPLALTPLDIPNVTDWKIARFDFTNPPAAGRIIKVQSTQSAFSLGYIAGLTLVNDAYGYFSAFGTFEFPDTTYMCTNAPSIILEGGYALSYEWKYNGVTLPGEDRQQLTVTQEGEYTLIMRQDPRIVTVNTFVGRIKAGTMCSDTLLCAGLSPGPLTVSGASGDTYRWESSPDGTTWTPIPGATSRTYTPPALTRTTWYRRGTGASLCTDRVYPATGVKVQVSPCVVPVNPHLRSRVIQ